MKAVAYLFAFAVVLSAASCSSKPDSPEATESAPLLKEDTAVDRTQVVSPAMPAGDTPMSPDAAVGP